MRILVNVAVLIMHEIHIVAAVCAVTVNMVDLHGLSLSGPWPFRLFPCVMLLLYQKITSLQAGKVHKNKVGFWPTFVSVAYAVGATSAGILFVGSAR